MGEIHITDGFYIQSLIGSLGRRTALSASEAHDYLMPDDVILFGDQRLDLQAQDVQYVAP